MIKKVTSVTLAGVLLLSMATPVKAAEEAKEVKEEVKVEQKVEEKEVKEEAKEDEKAEEAKEEEKKEEAKEEVRQVKATTQKVKLDGKEVVIYGYNIDDENYFKLRDLAAVLKDSPAKFGVEYKEGLVTLTKAADYEPLDTDQKEVKEESEAMLTNDKVMLGEEELTAKAYKIDGSNYYRLRDLGVALEFGVDYDEESSTVLLSSVKEEAKEDEKAEEAKEEAKEEKKEEAKDVKEETKEEVKEEKTEETK